MVSLRLILLLSFLLCLASASLISRSTESEEDDGTLLSEESFVRSLSADDVADIRPLEEEGTIWAVLVAGSSGWFNYRHQADVCHAWHTLINHGVDPEHMITMMYDDIADNAMNPHKGKLFNHPNGSDVYAGVRIDYKGEDVNPANFMAVLLGDEDAVDGKRVLKSTSTDRVFVYFTDHGANGLIGFPSDILSVKNLTDTLKGMHKRSLYKELTFYLEACESGSMFDHQLADSMEIYAVTAANDHESSWGCYCETKKVPGNCLGDLFSVNWMEDSDKENLRSETLATQFGIVRRKTTKSHVLNFGNFAIEEEYVGEFMGEKDSRVRMGDNRLSPQDFAMYPARDIPLFLLAHRARNGGNDADANALHILQKKRRFLERQMEQLVKKVLHDPVNQRRALSTYPARISQMECHHQIMHTFNRFCFNFSKNPYALKYAFVLTNLCEHRIQPERIQAILMEHCAGVQMEGIL